MRSFKKILLRIVILAGFVYLLETGIRFLYEDYKSYHIYARKEYKQEEGTLDTLFCGTSRTYSGLNPAIYDELTGSNSFNMATSAQDISNTYYIIKDAIRNNPIETIYLEVSVPTLGKTDNDTGRVVSTERIYTLWGKLDAALHESNSNLQVRDLFYSTRVSDYFDFEEVKKNILYKLSADSDTPPVTRPKKLHYICKGFYSSFRVYKPADTISIKKRYIWDRNKLYQPSVDALNDILTLCAENDIEVILYSPPISEPILPLIGDLNDMHACYQEIADAYGIDFYDMNFLIDHQTIFTNEMFRDSMHLNINGAEILTSTLARIHEDNEHAAFYFTEEYMGELKKE